MLLFFSGVKYEHPFVSVIKDLPYLELPFVERPKRIIARGIDVPSDIGGELTKLYTNVQCTEFFLAEDLGPHGMYNIKVPDSEYILVLLNFGSYTDFHTYNLYITNPQGEYLDKLEVKIWANASVKDFTVDEKGLVTVYQIIPENKHLLSGDEKEVFEAHRRDTVYSVKNGKFERIKEINYQSMKYRQEILGRGKPAYKIWEGNEISIDG